MGGNVLNTDLANITGWSKSEISLVQILKIGIDFSSEDAFMTEALQRNVKTSQSSKKIDKTQLPQAPPLAATCAALHSNA